MLLRLPGPAELGAVDPYAVHDYGQPARQRHDGRVDEDGEEITERVVSWSGEIAKKAVRTAHNARPLRLLMEAITDSLVDCGNETTPKAGMPVVKAVDCKYVRQRFAETYPPCLGARLLKPKNASTKPIGAIWRRRGVSN